MNKGTLAILGWQSSVYALHALFIATGEKKHAGRAISNDFHQLHAKNEHFTA